MCARSWEVAPSALVQCTPVRQAVECALVRIGVVPTLCELRRHARAVGVSLSQCVTVNG